MSWRIINFFLTLSSISSRWFPCAEMYGHSPNGWGAPCPRESFIDIMLKGLFRWFIHINDFSLWRKREQGTTEAPHTSLPVLDYTHQLIYRLDTSLMDEQRSSTAFHLPEGVVAHPPLPSTAEPEANTPKQGAYQPLPPAHSTWTIPRVFCHFGKSVNVCWRYISIGIWGGVSQSIYRVIT